jgi:hypothetical protein
MKSMTAPAISTMTPSKSVYWQTEENSKDEVICKLHRDKDITRFFETNSKQYILVSDLHLPRVFSKGKYHYINTCPGLKCKYRPFDTIPQATKEELQIFLDYIMLILASNVQESYDHLMKWLAFTLQGHKTTSAFTSKDSRASEKQPFPTF